MTTTVSAPPTTTPTGRARSTAFSVLIGLTAVLVLLQAVWAGIFLEHDGERDASSTWIEVHARGADVAIGLCLVAVIVALARLRSRRDLVFGSIGLLVLLAAEAYLGGLIRDEGRDVLTAVHVPLGMAIMALVVWLPLRARRPVLTPGR